MKSAAAPGGKEFAIAWRGRFADGCEEGVRRRLSKTIFSSSREFISFVFWPSTGLTFRGE